MLYRGPLKTMQILGRRLRYEYDSWRDKYTFHLSSTRGSAPLRIPYALLEQLHPCHQLCLTWEGINAELRLCVDNLMIWPADAMYHRCGNSTWVRLVRSAGSSPDGGYVVIHAPGYERSEAGQDGPLPGPLLAPEILQFSLWSSTNRPHHWPNYELYGNGNGEPILYTMGGVANGRFKLALMQLEAFRALESIAPLHLGFYDPAQGIDVAYPLKSLTLPVPKNTDTNEPYYVLDVARVSRWNDQLGLPL